MDLASCYTCTTIVRSPLTFSRPCRRCALCLAFPFCTCVPRQPIKLLPQFFLSNVRLYVYQYVASLEVYYTALFFFDFFFLTSVRWAVV